MSIGKITRVKLREVWKHEAHDFITWLEENTDVLNEALDFRLVNVEREKAAGNFNVDLVGEDENGNTVVIENQLEKSDHDHLGKVLTYLSALDAKAAVWIVAKPRPEHVKAVTWLNEATSTPFYLVQVEAVRIGESAPAALFTRIVGPSVEARAAWAVKKDFSERHETRHRFWTELLIAAKEKTKLHERISPSAYGYVGTSTGVRGLNWNYLIRNDHTMVELYIDQGDSEENTKFFNQLYEQKAAIETVFGGPLEWLNAEANKSCRIYTRIQSGGLKQEDLWAGAIEATVDAMIRFEKALGKHVKKLK